MYKDINVVGALFQALERLTVGQQLLRELRDLRGDADVTSWAARSHLDSPDIVEYAMGVREYWRHNPHRALQLNTNWLTVVVAEPDRGEKNQEWASTELGEHLLPRPRETERQFLLRQKGVFRDRRAFIGDERPNGRPNVAPPDVSPRHAEWFVFVNVAGERPTQLARRIDCDRAAVERATRKVASLLGVQRRTWPVGPPRQ